MNALIRLAACYVETVLTPELSSVLDEITLQIEEARKRGDNSIHYEIDLRQPNMTDLEHLVGMTGFQCTTYKTGLNIYW